MVMLAVNISVSEWGDMANVKRTTRDSKGNVLYTVLMTHASHSSAAGRFQAGVCGSLIIGKESWRISDNGSLSFR